MYMNSLAVSLISISCKILACVAEPCLSPILEDSVMIFFLWFRAGKSMERPCYKIYKDEFALGPTAIWL